MSTSHEGGSLIRSHALAGRRYHIIAIALGTVSIPGGLLFAVSVYLCMWFDIGNPLFSWAGNWDALIRFLFNFGFALPWLGAAGAWAKALILELERSRVWSAHYAKLVTTFIAFVALPPILMISTRLVLDATLL